MGLKALAKSIKTEVKKQSETLPEKFLRKLDTYLVSSRQKEREKQDAHSGLYIRPSSYYKCMRQTWYRMKKFPSKDNSTAKGLRTLEIGTALHEWVQRDIFMQKDFPYPLVPADELPCFNQQGLELFTKEQNRIENRPEMEIGWIDKRWTSKYFIYSIIDGALDIEHMYYLFEFKTINPDDFKYLYEPLEEHKKQATLYALSLGIDNILFLYINKANSEWKAFEYYVTEEQKEWALKRVIHLDYCLVNDILPDKEITPLPKYGPNVTSCRYCSYKNICEKDVCTHG
jgi:CRISPR/Cas system-associated exonuclease Cas4 (RecB family)